MNNCMHSEAFTAELELVCRRGVEQASGALSFFLNRQVSITVSAVAWLSIDMIPTQVAGRAGIMAGLLTRFSGALAGNALLLFPEEDALRLLGAYASEDGQLDLFDLSELQRSMLQETGNLTFSYFGSSLSNYLGQKVMPGAPVLVTDLGEAILNVALLECAQESDSVLAIATRFYCDEAELGAQFYVFPNPESFACLQRGLGHSV